MRGQSHRSSGAAFSLLELLTVMAIIGILAALLLPTVGRARRSADRTRARVQFAEWAAAMELFRQEYGHYPDLTSGAGSSGRVDGARFLGALTGRDGSGHPVAASGLNGNRRRIPFLHLAPGALARTEGTELCDALGNSELVVLVDADDDGWIRGPEWARLALRTGNSGVGFAAAAPAPSDEFPTEGLRAGVAFYSAGTSSAAIPAYVCSWP